MSIVANTVGDLIMGFREAATDIPRGTLSAPGAELTVALLASANTLPSGNYFVKTAYRTPWGETLPSSETGPLVVDATHGIQVTGTLPLGVSAVVAYVGVASNAENFAFVSTSLPLQILSSSGGYSDTPGVRNTAFMPDSDGTSVSAFSVYRWINDGLEDGAAQCGGGIPDISGVSSVAGQGIYTLQGNWWRVMRAWYDGYPMSVSGTDSIFRKNKVTGTYAMGLSVSHVDERIIIESWPQPSRTGGSMTVTPALTATSLGTFTAVAGASSFVLPFGLAQLGPDAAGNVEIVWYTSVVGGSSITLAIRGLGGTIAQGWGAVTPISELNLFFHGLRIPPKYLIGQSSFVLNVPPGWKAALSHYLLHRFRLIERDSKFAAEEYKQFVSGIKESPMNKPVGGPRQIQIGGGQRMDTVPGAGSVFGGIILP
jgi:hypothetical protein